MKIPQTLTVDASSSKEKEKVVDVVYKEVITLDSLLKGVEEATDNLKLVKEPSEIDNFDNIAVNYFLTQSNIKKIISFSYKHKEKEEWLDINLIEYQPGKLGRDLKAILLQQQRLDTPKQEFGALKFLVKKDYALLIQTHSKSLDSTSRKILDYYKEMFGMKKVIEDYKFV